MDCAAWFNCAVRAPDAAGDYLGYTKVRVRILNPSDEKRFLETEILVDTGAMYTVVSSKRLKELGIEC